MSASALSATILNLDASLSAYWKCDEASGNLADSSGNARTLTSSGSGTTYGASGAAGRAISLNGSGYFTRADSVLGATLPAAWSMFCLVKGAAQDSSRILAVDGTVANVNLNSGWTGFSQSTSFGVTYMIRDDGTNEWGNAAADDWGPLLDDKWHSVLQVRDNVAGKWIAYLDGVEVASKTASQGTYTLTSSTIGATGAGTAKFTGSIQHVAMWSSFTATAVQAARLHAAALSASWQNSRLPALAHLRHLRHVA